MVFQRATVRRHPDVIVQALNVKDVQEAVRYAAHNGIKVTTRCGGHSYSSSFLREDGMLIDVSHLDGIEVDKDTKTAIVDPGVFGRRLNQRLAEEGLAFPTAHAGIVPLSGFLLGGGVGLNGRAWAPGGISTFAVTAVDIVTADGQLRHASRTENPDLFWAVRGGGPGLFGVVVKFHLQCFDAPGTIWTVNYMFPSGELDTVIETMVRLAPQLEKNVKIGLGMTPAPAHARDRIHLSVYAFTADEKDGRRLVAPVSNDPIITRALEHTPGREISIDDYYAADDDYADTYRNPHMMDTIWTEDPHAAFQILKKHIAENPSSGSYLSLHYLGSDPLPDSAFSKKASYYIGYTQEWSHPEQEAACRDYSVKVFNELKPLAHGSYINEMDQIGRASDIPDSYSPDAWARLSTLRQQWDPKNVFHDFYGRE
ncbi:FAD-binding oxidoreductase [Streptomyces sp. NPDC094034]|uniref:FAD-binding oxidoreductase n=1 Tax=Streptomyces sp. NPDC094034 TaxID=3155309 RepID=UPI00331F113D